MRSKWVKCRVGDVALCNAETYSPAERWDYVNYLDTSNITSGTIGSIQTITDHRFLPSRARRKVQRGDIVYSTVRPNQRHYGIIAHPLPNMLVSTGFAVIRGREGKCDTQFLYYYLTQAHVVEYLHSIAENSTSAYPSIKPSDIESLEVELPPLPVQRRIAGILGALDDKIELNRRMSRTLEAMARALFKSWFVDFEPVRAKMEGRWKKGQSLPGLPADLYDLFPDRLVDSELGEIPEGWAVKPVGEVVRCVGGATPSTSNVAFWEGGNNPFVTPKDMALLQGPVLLDSERHVTDAGVDRISSKQLPVGTVLLSSRAPIGYLAVAAVPVSVNQGIIAMICDGALPNLYVLHWVAHNVDSIKGRAGGTTFAEISKRNFRPMPVLVPPRCVLNHFMAIAQPCYDRIASTARQNCTLAALRDALLPRLLSGEIDVSALEGLADLPAQAGEVS